MIFMVNQSQGRPLSLRVASAARRVGQTSWSARIPRLVHQRTHRIVQHRIAQRVPAARRLVVVACGDRLLTAVDDRDVTAIDVMTTAAQGTGPFRRASRRSSIRAAGALPDSIGTP
jgi:hypothetical protein